ncbi:MAG: DNA mismatch repair endonuclease MutL [Candidatus Nanoarchaeia archaeon]
MPIIQLDEGTINQIAAGEVIERPASVVKELIENSLDAGADKIDVYIVDGGKKKIVVEDNGTGMNEGDAEKSILRHATSKIKNYHDLFSICTMGFRGEALSSVASVSDMTILTKEEISSAGIKLHVYGGDVKTKSSVAANKGTKISINDIFFNVPARKKFLKGKNYEQKLITDIVSRYALIHTKKSFSLRNEDGLIIAKPVTSSIKENMASVYGLEVAKESFEVSSGIIKGFIAKPTVNRSTRDYISVYVNSRYVKCKVVEDALLDAMRTFLFHGRFPIAGLNLSISPKSVDVNVHPSKKVIKFHDDSQIYQEVFDAVKGGISASDLFTTAKVKPKQITIDDSDSKKDKEIPKSTDHGKYFKTSDESQSVFIKEKKEVYESDFGFNVVGQIHRTYIIIETEEGYSIVDQHAAEERINYEKIKKGLEEKKGLEKQSLLNGYMLELNAKDFSRIMEQGAMLEKFGFVFEEFGKNCIMLREIPASIELENESLKDTIITLAEKFSESHRKNFDEKKEESLKYMACRMSLKAGEELNPRQMKGLVQLLLKTENKYTCPHGRPTMLKFPLSKIEKDFKRTE